MFTLRRGPAENSTHMTAGRAIGSLTALLALCFCATTARAQYHFDHWTTDNGLPQNSVRCIMQTRDGYLWFTTFDGLVRFDGVRFTVFNKANSPGIPNNRFTTLFEDRIGDIWAAMESGEVVRRHKGRFTTYTKGKELADIPISGLVGDGMGNVALYTLQSGLSENGKTPSNSIRGYRWSEGRFQLAEDLSHTLSEAPSSDEESGRSVIVDGDLWILANQRVICYQKGGGIQAYPPRSGFPGTQPRLVLKRGRPSEVVTRDAAGRLWITDLQSMHNQLLSLQTPEGFDRYEGYADDEGNYWFGTFNNGLLRARRQIVTPYAIQQGLDVKESYPLLESRDGSIWIGTGEQGAFRLKDGAFTQYPDTSIYLTGGSVTNLYEDRAGELWLNGFWRFVQGRFVPVPWMNEALRQALIGVWTTCEDQAGAYWFGMATGVGRYQNGVFTTFTTKDGLAGNDTKVIIEDGQGGLWLGSYGGLTHYKDAKFTAWTDKDGLPGNSVRALKLDDDGALWIGTYDSGLGRFKDGRFASCTTENGLFDNGAFQMLEDDYGWFWISCNRGIYRVRKQELNDFCDAKVKTLNCLAYNKNDGMPSSECNGGRWPAGVKSRDGKLWFPTMGGVAMVDPSSISANTQPPPVMIEAMRVNNQPVPYDVWDAATGTSQSPIRILPGQDNFEIEYTALSFINSENLRFRYRMEGADQDWVEAGTRRTAYFSHLTPGDYTFRVIAANADGVWNTTGASVRVRIVPPFWSTWWFVTLVVLAAAAVISGMWKYRIGQVRRVQMAQQAFAEQLIASQESERKRIASELHDSLGQNLLIVKNWALVGLNTLAPDNPGREHLDEISQTTQLALEEVREIAHNLRPYQLERLGLTKTLEFMMQQIENSSDIEFAVELENIDRLLSAESEINLYRIVQEMINNVIKHSDATEAGLFVKRPAGGIQIVCRDNGKGFDPAAAAVSRHSGMGLSGLAERVRILGGHYTIGSAPGTGTTVTVSVNTPQQ
jgi:signal transduction histidine kinase/ligand-binding sensor domain-containing protein